MLRTAFRFMMYDKSKTIGAAVGVVVAIFLIGQQTGIFLFLTGLMDALISNADARVWVTDKNVKDVNSLSPVDVRKGNEVRSVAGVKNVWPLVISGTTLQLDNGKTAPVQLIGSLAPYFSGGPWNVVQGDLNGLISSRGIAADMYDLQNLGDIRLGDELSLGGKLVELRAVTKGARGFGANYIFTNVALAKELGNYPTNEVSAFLIDIKPGYSAEEVVNEINRRYTGIHAWTSKDFSWSTITKILKDGGIGESVGSLIIFAIIAGGVIIGLTLYSAAVDRIDDYATMKAIGAHRSIVTRLMLIQAAIIAITGFVLGALMIQGFRFGVQGSGVRFAFPWYLWLALFGLTLLISLSGAWFASRSISKVEPSKVF